MQRTLPPLKLPQSPLEFVLAQARFEPILTIEKSIPEIQNTLRKLGFTHFSERTVEISTEALGAAFNMVQAPSTQFKQWELMHSSRTQAFIIDRESITLQATRYTTFEAFADILRRGVDALAEHAAPTEARRVGLRYVDTIQPSGKAFDWYVNPALQGIDLAQFGRALGRTTETLIETGQTRRLRVRYTEAIRGLVIPIDLLPIQLKLKSDVQLATPFATLDSDHFDTGTTDFDSTSVMDRIGSLHDTLDQAFRKLVTQQAIDFWATGK